MLFGLKALSEDVCELVERTDRDCNSYDELKDDEYLCEAFKTRTETDATLCTSKFGHVDNGMNFILLVGIVCLVVSVATCVVLAFCYFKHMYIIYDCRKAANSSSKSPLLKGTPINSPGHENRSYDATNNVYANNPELMKK
ncbi:Oidioi.mRNA.OKI2018_I69.XSR.g15653.t1.cds [Oikopleura dioica]|uniref:Oidioi.mRNA.OKI2018_I69.XSR.g15653.t1.cds n=1 Tax=Oikopleura dioica TaxID=34765 RepID=A0ABN7SHJ6_OIKDI|nr:Oidioi.mRNA.OKI2018_I69.XSR.g15653.t1.cds [Oikopleura dioica]